MKSNIKKIESVLSPRDLLQISSLVPYIFFKAFLLVNII